MFQTKDIVGYIGNAAVVTDYRGGYYVVACNTSLHVQKGVS